MPLIHRAAAFSDDDREVVVRYFVPGKPGEVILWETQDGVRCISTRPATGPRFEITISLGDIVLSRMAFEHDEDAANFAIAAMQEVADRPARRGSPAYPQHETTR